MAPRRKPVGSQLLEIVKSAPIAPAARGRLLSVKDVQAMLPRNEAGAPVSRWWINHHFAPEYKRKLGRTNVWWETDAIRWIDEQLADRRSA